MAQKSQIRRENEEKILAAAEDIFSEYGYRGASVGMIAELADVPKPNVYYYFGSKDDLYRRVMEDVCASWMVIADEFADEADPAQVFTSYVRAKMAHARARPKGSRIWAMEMARGASFLTGYFEAEMRPWLTKREAVVANWAAAGRIAKVNPRQLFYMIWATTQHYADFAAQIAALEGHESYSDAAYADVTEQVVQLVLGAVGLATCQ